jgi:hypothetical protein
LQEIVMRAAICNSLHSTFVPVVVGTSLLRSGVICFLIIGDRNLDLKKLWRDNPGSVSPFGAGFRDIEIDRVVSHLEPYS